MHRHLIVKLFVICMLCASQTVAAEGFWHSVFKPFFKCDGSPKHNNGPDWLCFPEAPAVAQTKETDTKAAHTTTTSNTAATTNTQPAPTTATAAATSTTATASTTAQTASVAAASTTAISTSSKKTTSAEAKPIVEDLTPKTTAAQHSLSSNASIKENSQAALKVDPKAYTIQLVATKTLKDLTAFRKKFNYSEGYVLTTKNKKGTVWYILLHDIYYTRTDAQNAVKALPNKLQKNGPWVRGMKRLQQSII